MKAKSKGRKVNFKGVIHTVDGKYDHLSLKAVEYGVFTPHELIAAVDLFETDFDELFWMIENLKGEFLITRLRTVKIEYDHRFYIKYCRPDKEGIISGHLHMKIILFIENSIKHPPKKLIETKYDFAHIFKSQEEKEYVLKELVRNDFIFEIDHSWKHQERNQKTVLVTLFRVLNEKGYLRKEASNDRIFANISKNYFDYSISEKTFYINIGNKDYFSEFNFLRQSKAK